MNRNRPTALVTGGAGFIGSHMVDLLLSEGFIVRVIDDLSGGQDRNLVHHGSEPALSLEERDIRSLEPHDQIFSGISQVFHFAGIGDVVPSIERPTDYLDVNVQGTVRILEGARFAGADKFVYAASSSCYGLAAVPTPETAPICPQYPYALSKHLGELAVLHWHQVYRLPGNSIRIFNAFGPRSRTTGAYGAVMGVFLRQKIAGRPFTVVGDGSQRRDFIHVSDVVRAFLAASRADMSGQTWNVGRGHPESVNHLVELLGGEVVHVPKRPGEPDCTWADITKIRRDLGWAPEVSFTEGVRAMLDDIEYWTEAPLWDADSIGQATATWFAFLGDRGEEP